MDVLTGVALAAPAGLNAYIPLLALGIAERSGLIALDSPYSLLGEWWAIALLALLFIVEFVADKTASLDHLNDVVHTVVRPATGAALAVCAVSGTQLSPVVLALVGGLMAGSNHALKASLRPAINDATRGRARVTTSVLEDLGSVVLTLVSFLWPVVVLLGAIAGLSVLVVMLLTPSSRPKRRRSDEGTTRRSRRRSAAPLAGRRRAGLDMNQRGRDVYTSAIGGQAVHRE